MPDWRASEVSKTLLGLNNGNRYNGIMELIMESSNAKPKFKYTSF